MKARVVKSCYEGMQIFGFPGGHDIRDLNPQWFRQKIAMVSQEPTLFACSIKDNIMYGRDATIEEVSGCAKVYEHISTKGNDFCDFCLPPWKR